MKGILAWLGGLRPRLVVAFVLVALASSAVAGAVSYRVARDALLADAQNTAMARTLNEVNAALPTLPYPPNQTALDAFARSLSGNVLVTYGDTLQARSGGPAPDALAGLRRDVPQHDGLRYQRVVVDGVPWLAYGSRIATTDGRPSGLEVYGLADLSGPQHSIDELARTTLQFTLLSLIPAIALALLAARGVLRPVRGLREAARRLAAGELDTRLRVRGSDELAELVSTFNDTAEALERNVNRLRRMESDARRFVADVSHELRTPLAAMVAVTDTLDEEAGGLSGDAATAARLISSETRKLATLVENLIEISRFDAGGAELRLDGPVDIGAAVSATLAARGWTDRIDTDLPQGIMADVDRRRLDIIVANLVGNALSHGAPPVTVTATRVRSVPEATAESAAGTAAASRVAEGVAVTVADRGPGLSPEVGPHVFDRFYKADTARGRSEGSGLGLAIALENARLHGGVIEACNRAGGGAEFRLILPRYQQRHQQPAREGAR